MTSSEDAAAWRDERSRAAAHRQHELDQRRAREAAAARELIARFVADARERGVEPRELRARSFSGRASYRTGLKGWYLRHNESVAVGTDGQFYVLSVQGGVAARVRGARPQPSDPPLVLGKGGRDGESIDLADALRAVLAAG